VGQMPHQSMVLKNALAPPLRATSCNVHYSGSILYDNERETWSKSSERVEQLRMFGVHVPSSSEHS
jgi:hypothetical protein